MATGHPDKSEQRFDRVLDRLQSFGSQLADGFTNHAPMVVEALGSLGRSDAAEAWVERYLAGALPRVDAGVPIDGRAWQAALGVPALEGRWRALFDLELAAGGWRPTLSKWTERLAPGFAAAAAHGVIRTAHAARALGRLDTVARRGELAAALALWACSWQRLPGDPLAGGGTLAARDALQAIPLVPPGARRNAGAITLALAVLDAQADFAAGVARLDRARPFDELALEVATAFAVAFLEQVHSAQDAIVFTHAITGVAAARRLASLTGDATGQRLLAYAWQTGAALQACYAQACGAGASAAVPGVQALVDGAVAHGDEHVIKLTEACLEFHRATANPCFLRVAARAMAAIPPV